MIPQTGIVAWLDAPDSPSWPVQVLHYDAFEKHAIVRLFGDMYMITSKVPDSNLKNYEKNLIHAFVQDDVLRARLARACHEVNQYLRRRGIKSQRSHLSTSEFKSFTIWIRREIEKNPWIYHRPESGDGISEPKKPKIETSNDPHPSSSVNVKPHNVRVREQYERTKVNFVCPVAECRRPFMRKTSLTNHLKAHYNKSSRPIQAYLKMKSSKIVKVPQVATDRQVARICKLPPISQLTAIAATDKEKSKHLPKLTLSPLPMFPLTRPFVEVTPKMHNSYFSCNGPVHRSPLPLVCELCGMQNGAAIFTTLPANDVKKEANV